MKLIIQKRFKNLLLDIIKTSSQFPKTDEYQIIRKQVIRSSSSSAANYRAACRAKSTRDFIHKLKIVEEEIDETNFWLEILVAMEHKKFDLSQSIEESKELLAITVSSLKTVKSNYQKNKS